MVKFSPYGLSLVLCLLSSVDNVKQTSAFGINNLKKGSNMLLRFGGQTLLKNTVPSILQRSSPQSSSTSSRLMCGLVAAIDDVWNSTTSSSYGDIPLLNDFDKPQTPENVLSQTSRKLHHRGPDGMTVSSGSIGSSADGSSSAAARWAMGHTRLAIVDPDNRAADMPFELTFDNKVIKLAANGEIYNHEILYNKLRSEENWPHDRASLSDCEVIGHLYAKYGGPEGVKLLDGMFGFVIFEEDTSNGTVKAFAARDPVGIKPLYYGRTKNSQAVNGNGVTSAGGYAFASELKALVGHVEPESVVAIPPGHYWTPEEGLVCYYNPDWLRKDDHAPWTDSDHSITDDEIRSAFTAAIKKRMMADVDYGFFLSGGVDSAVVSNILMPLYRDAQLESGEEFRRIPTYTVGMKNSPDVMAAKAVVEDLGGDKYIDHHIRYFTPDEVFDTIPKIIYHMETYEAELIRSSIPNWFLAERAAQDVKMVLTGEGSDELFAGYLYFQDCPNPTALQNELKRIYNMLGNINLHRTDRMTMAHGLEARVPFLDTEFTKLVMGVNPERKIVDKEAVKNNSRGREKTMLRELYEGPNANGDVIPQPVLWRAKAMQCEGVGEDWVSILQNKISALISDEEMAQAESLFPINTPHTKEEFYYRKIYEEHFHGMEHVVKLWPGGGRAMGAEWKSEMYTREGLKDVNLLTHALQEKIVQKGASTTTTALNAAASSSNNVMQSRSSSSLAFSSHRLRQVGWSSSPSAANNKNDASSSTRLFASIAGETA